MGNNEGTASSARASDFLHCVLLDEGVEIKTQPELGKDRIKDLKDPLFLLFWSGQKDLHI